jgi:hypothetical protein
MSKSLGMFGLHVIHQLAANSTINHFQQSRDCPEWTWLWADTSLSEFIRTSNNNADRWYDAYSNVCGSCPEWLENTPFSNIKTLKPNDISEWERSAKALSSEMVQLGAVVTGSLASIPIKDLDLGSFWLNRLGITAERRIIENVDSPLGLSALGATIHAQRMANDQPSYLDTLPRIKMMVTKQGEPVWIDLLKEDDDYVEGGKEFFKDGIGKGIIAIPAGRKSLMIALNHEEYTTVREIESPFNIETTKTIPVSLSAAIKPAQGNARLEVVPEQGTISNHKRIYARWETMKDTGQTTEEYLNSMDRVCPPVTVRRHGKEPWLYVRMLIEQAMKSKIRKPNTFERIRIALQHRDYGKYPVSSDGTVFLYQEVIDEFISKIVEKLKTTSTEGWFYSEGWRILAHSFAKHPDIEYLLNNLIDEYGTELRAQQLLAVGRCVRSPELAAKFIDVFLARLEQSHTGVNNWLRAFSELAKYRANTFEQLQKGICERLWQQLIPIFKNELQPGDAALLQILRFSFVGLAFLLRRRAFEPNFMPPESLLAQKAKSVAYHAHEMARTGKLHFAENSAINMEMELKRFIDYVDKKGHGFFAIADWD